jgi:hypothetical protein
MLPLTHGPGFRGADAEMFRTDPPSRGFTVFLFLPIRLFEILNSNAVRAYCGENMVEQIHASGRKKKMRRPPKAHPLVGRTYDLAIRACRRGEANRSQKAIRLLREVMRSVGPEDSSDLMRCFDWCVDRIGEGEFTLAAETLADLQKAWEDAGRQLPA